MNKSEQKGQSRLKLHIRLTTSLLELNTSIISTSITDFQSTLTLLVLVIWGFIGTRYARFSNFVTTPTTALQHIKELAEKPKHYIGHNPAGGLMVIVMLITLSVVTLSGFKIYAIEEGKGPLAADLPSIKLISEAHADDDDHDNDDDHEHDEHEHHDDDDDEHEHEGEEDWAEEFWEEIHEASANFMVLLIILHITGVIVMSRLQGESLVKAMITGKKNNTSTDDDEG